jgi:hypothetical protein
VQAPHHVGIVAARFDQPAQLAFTVLEDTRFVRREFDVQVGRQAGGKAIVGIQVEHQHGRLPRVAARCFAPACRERLTCIKPAAAHRPRLA